MLLPTNPDFGTQIQQGNERNILKTWQVRPPGAGRIYELVRSSHLAEEGLPAESWEFWIDHATGLPIKAQIAQAGQPKSYVYYTYEPTTQAAELPADFWKGNGREAPACELGLTAVVNSNPRAPVIVYSKTGQTYLEPLGAAAEGTHPRATLTPSGIKLQSVDGDEAPLRWEVDFASDQELVTSEGAVIVKSATGKEVVRITSSTGVPPKIEEVAADPGNPISSGDVLVLESTEETLEVSAVEPLSLEPNCEEGESGTESPSVSPFAASTAQVIVYVNPYPGVGNVKVGLSGPCADHEKYIGADNKVVFGSCTPGAEYTVQVPENVFNEGRHHVEPSHIRTFTLPASNHVVEFHYGLEGGEAGGSPPPPPPPPPPAEEYELGLEIIEGVDVLGNEGEEGPAEATASNLGPIVVQSVLPLIQSYLDGALLDYPCAGDGVPPVYVHSGHKPYLQSPTWVQCGPLNEAAKYYWLTFHQTIEIFDGTEWEPVARLSEGPDIPGFGMSFGPVKPPRAVAMATVYQCRSIEHLHRFRVHDQLEGEQAGEPIPLPRSVYSAGALEFCR
jgi:hypothetical protein